MDPRVSLENARDRKPEDDNVHMIGFIEGTPQITTRNTLIIMTTGGIGYEVAATTNTVVKMAGQAKVSLFTHLVVKDDALDLYGFLKQSELLMLKLLIGV